MNAENGRQPLGEASRLALRNLWHWRTRTIVLVMLTALAVASYLATSMFTAQTMAGLVPEARLGLTDMVVLELTDWAYLQVRFLDDPALVEHPETETRYRTLVTDEPGSELDLMRADPQVAECHVARFVTLELPWGTDEVFSIPAALFAELGAGFVAGSPPAAPLEIAIPAQIAGRLGLSPGSPVPYRAIDPERAEYSDGEMTVSGIFELDHPFFDGAVGWLPDRFGEEYTGSVAAHYPRVLVNFEPNAYVVRLQPGADPVSFMIWATETGYRDSDGCLHFHPRFPVARAWNDDVAEYALATGVMAQTTPLGGIVLLSLSFVGVGALTMLLLGFLDRRREIAVLKTVGFSGGDIAAVFGLEVTYTGLAGLAAGLAVSFSLVTLWLGRKLPPALVARAGLITAAVLALSALLPIAMASAATVTELLVGRKVVAIIRQRVGAGDGRPSLRPGRGASAYR